MAIDVTKTTFVLKQLFAAYVHAKPEKGTVAVYMRLLQDIPPDDLQTVVDQCIADCKFLPTVAEIRDRYHSLTRTLGEMSGAEAWGMVMGEIRRIGSWGTPHFEIRRVAKAVEIMGWNNICRSDEPAVDRAQFMRIYDQLAQRDEQVQRLLPQARTMAAHRGLVPIGDSLRALVDRRTGEALESEVQP